MCPYVIVFLFPGWNKDQGSCDEVPKNFLQARTQAAVETDTTLYEEMPTYMSGWSWKTEKVCAWVGFFSHYVTKAVESFFLFLRPHCLRQNKGVGYVSYLPFGPGLIQTWFRDQFQEKQQSLPSLVFKEGSDKVGAVCKGMPAWWGRGYDTTTGDLNL